MKTLLILAALMATPFAQESKPHSHEGEVLDRTVTERVTPVAGGTIVAMNVNGLVCDFCAIAIDKVFRREAGVADVAVDLSDKIVVVALEPGTDIDDKRLEKLINNSGYDLVSVKRGVAAS